jgi:hypothetical protein
MFHICSSCSAHSAPTKIRLSPTLGHFSGRLGCGSKFMSCEQSFSANSSNYSIYIYSILLLVISILGYIMVYLLYIFVGYIISILSVWLFIIEYPPVAFQDIPRWHPPSSTHVSLSCAWATGSVGTCSRDGNDIEITAFGIDRDAGWCWMTLDDAYDYYDQ